VSLKSSPIVLNLVKELFNSSKKACSEENFLILRFKILENLKAIAFDLKPKSFKSLALMFLILGYLDLVISIYLYIEIIFLNEIQIWQEFPFDIVVVELGTDAPGQINQFRKY
jgi:hypothetical protein